MVRALVVVRAHRKAERLRETRRAEAGFVGDRHSLNGAWPRAAGLAKHWAVHALHSGGKAQAEH